MATRNGLVHTNGKQVHNGKPPSRELVVQYRQAQNEYFQARNEYFTSRTSLLGQINGGTKRDIDRECVYPKAPYSSCFYRELYNYNAIASRVVDVYPKEMFKATPYLQETEKDRVTAFEKDVNELFANPKIRLLSQLLRADCLSGVARFGGLILGLNDGKALDQPVTTMYDDMGEPLPVENPLKLLYLRPFDEFSCEISATEENKTSPRYGAPLYYELKTANAKTAETKLIESPIGTGYTTQKIHWTRVIHYSEDPIDSFYLSPPRMQKVIPQIWDLRKVGGGSAEMYWQGAFPGLSIEALAELFTQGMQPEFDEQSIKDQMELYRLGQQKYIALRGAKANSLAPNVASPEPFMATSLQMLCAGIDVPLKIFLGSESGHLASMQDTKKWDKSTAARRENYGTPVIIRGLFDRLITYKCISKPRKYTVEWVDATARTDQDNAGTSLKMAQALSQYAGSNSPSVMGPKSFLTRIMNFTDEIADKAITEAMATKKDFLPPEPKVQKAGGQPAKKSSGRKKGTVSKK